MEKQPNPDRIHHFHVHYIVLLATSSGDKQIKLKLVVINQFNYTFKTCFCLLFTIAIEQAIQTFSQPCGNVLFTESSPSLGYLPHIYSSLKLDMILFSHSKYPLQYCAVLSQGFSLLYLDQCSKFKFISFIIPLPRAPVFIPEHKGIERLWDAFC